MKKIISSIATLWLVASCTSDYNEINTNIYGVTPAEERLEGLAYGAPFIRMQQLVIPIGSPARTTGPGNDLQNTDLISSGNYIGYFGNNNNWNNSIEATWEFRDDRMSYAYRNFYSNTYTEWKTIKDAVGDSKELKDQQAFALAEILKVATWLRATDVFGPIAYTNAGKGEITPSLDSQETVYKAMLADLDNASTLLQSGGTLMAEYDAIYNGNLLQWRKLANSLMLRIAVRAHFKDQALANTYITKALANGVIESIDDEAKIKNSSKMPLKNSMMPSVEEYGETRMGETIRRYLVGYNDPRGDKYFTKVDVYGVQDFDAIAQSWDMAIREAYKTRVSKPRVTDDAPLFWLRASEVLFLKAEAALFNLGGLTASQAKGFYEAGVRMSFQENSVAGADAYLQQTELPSNEPSTTTSFYNYSYGYNLTDDNVSPSWDDNASGSQEVSLQKIITQKYLALYPNAVEAWTEYRRTGYPFVMPPVNVLSRPAINCPTCMVPERFKYSANEYSTNKKMATEVPALLGGQDTGATPLWWVRPSRPQQKP